MKYLFILCFLFFISFASAQKKCIDCSCFVNKSETWAVNVDDYGKEYLIRGDSLKLNNNSFSVHELVVAFNKKKKAQVELVKVKNSTVYVKIIDTAYFQHMGYANVSWYLAVLVFTLTEHQLCKCVYIGFSEGDHTGPPGFFTRETFKKRYVICN